MESLPNARECPQLINSTLYSIASSLSPQRPQELTRNLVIGSVEGTTFWVRGVSSFNLKDTFVFPNSLTKQRIVRIYRPVMMFLYLLNLHIPPSLETWRLIWRRVNFCTFFLDSKCVFLLLGYNLSDVGQTKSVKIIKDKDEKPKGFGYIEFEELEGLKDALSKTGSVFPYFSHAHRE